MSTVPSTTATDVASALKAAEERFAASNPKSLQRFRDAASSMPGGNSTALYYSPFPVTFVKGEAQRLTDLDGHVYTDFLGEYSAGLYGHSHPAIIGAAHEALDGGIALGGPNQYEAELADLLTARFPSVDLIRFTNSGTEANIMAIATARLMSGKDKILVFEAAYHGSVLSFRGVSPINVPYPSIVATFNDAAGAAALIEQNRDDLAAVIVEPVLGGGGAIPGTSEFLHALRDATSRTGTILIFDEVMTSRLGPGGVQGIEGITPDMTTFGKYVGGGLTFGAFGGARRLMERYDPAHPQTIGHPGTFNNNVLSMAAGAAGLREVFTPDVAVWHNERGDVLRERLNALFAETGVEMIASGRGSLINVHFQSTPISTPSDIVACEPKRALLHLEMMARGFYFARRGYMPLSLALEQTDFDGLVEALGDFIAQHQSILG